MNAFRAARPPALAPAPPPIVGDIVANVGLVVIGRNEGERLRRCLASAARSIGTARAVYVDSGSTDGSVQQARAAGVEVVDLDTSVKFTAARARNAGVQRLVQIAPDTDYVMFVDGDCEIVETWWAAATARLDADAALAVACGRRRERFPARSVYNRLCDMEWDTPVGRALACGGDSMMRLAAFRAVGGFNADLIAGEEPELCLRLRQAGYAIERVGTEMTLHDAAMTRFSQWWKREKRAGFATAEGAAMYGHLPERYRVHTHVSNWFWGLALPLLALGPAWWSHGWSLVLLLAYPLQWGRIVHRLRGARGLGGGDARLYATFCLLGKFPQMLGQAKYWLGRLFGRPSQLIEYKGAEPPAPPPAAPPAGRGPIHIAATEG